MRHSPTRVHVLLFVMTPLLSRSAMQRRNHGARVLLQRKRLLRLTSNEAALLFQSVPSRNTCTRRRISPIIVPRSSSCYLHSTTSEVKDHSLDPCDILRDLQKLADQETPKIPLPTHLSPTSLEQVSHTVVIVVAFWTGVAHIS